MPWWMKTTNHMLAGLLLGTLLGLAFGSNMAAFSPVGDVFITLLQMVAIPLIFFNVITAIAKLPDQDCEIIIMRHYEQLSNQEVAADLSLTEAAASMRYLRAVRRLRDLLGPEI